MTELSIGIARSSPFGIPWTEEMCLPADEDNPIGNAESICPYCDYRLQQRPSRKKQCPNCGGFIRVRTRPSDRMQVLVTESQAGEIDEQWMKVMGTYENHLEERRRFEAKKAALRARFGREPSDSDTQWSLWNEDLMMHAKAGNWGLYRNTRFDMAEQLRKEGRLKSALAAFLELAYLDANGPNNVGSIAGDPEMLRKYPPFDPRLGRQASAVTHAIKRLAEKLDLSPSEIRQRYLEVNESVYRSLRLPLPPSECWETIKADII